MIDEEVLSLFGVTIKREPDITELDFSGKSFVLIQRGYVTIRGSEYGNVYQISLAAFLKASWNTYIDIEKSTLKLYPFKKDHFDREFHLALDFTKVKNKEEGSTLDNFEINKYIAQLFGFIYDEIERVNKKNRLTDFGGKR